jgi:hypothetical protein
MEVQNPKVSLVIGISVTDISCTILYEILSRKESEVQRVFEF